MTPAIKQAKRAKISYTLHEYTHDSSSQSYGLEAAEKMAVSPTRVFKTLIVTLNTNELVVAVVPVSSMMSMKQLAKAAKSKKAAMADAQAVERSTGYVLGGVSPLGQKKRLRTFIDTSAVSFETIFISAGRRGLEIELKVEDLKILTQGIFEELSQG